MGRPGTAGHRRPGDAVSIEWIVDHRRFTEISRPWDDLAEAEATPFARHAWFDAWWRAFGERSRLRVCAAWQGGDLRAVFPLCGRQGVLQAMANVHTPEFRPLARDQRALEQVSEAVVEAAGRGLQVPALRVDSPALSTLLAVSRRKGRFVATEPQHTSPVVDTSGDFSIYRRETKPRWGSPLERFRRKAQRESGGRFFLLEQPVDLDAELERGFRVEASGWKGQRGTAVLSSQRTTLFYRSLARAFHETGEVRVSGVVLDDRLAAFDLSLLYGGRLYLIKTGYDESYRRLAPGLMLRLSIIERCFELDLEAHELLGNTDAWKLKFSTGERRHYGFYCYPRTADGLLRTAYRRGIRPALKEVQAKLPSEGLIGREAARTRSSRQTGDPRVPRFGRSVRTRTDD
jgi:CelD/BcsL family acetyltransferase involved in cellulose biosynthesis